MQVQTKEERFGTINRFILDWKARDYLADDAFYVWAPPVPDDFMTNHESAARRVAA